MATTFVAGVEAIAGPAVVHPGPPAPTIAGDSLVIGQRDLRALQIRPLIIRPRADGRIAGAEEDRDVRRLRPGARDRCAAVDVGLRVERLRLRTGSYANWPVVAFAAADNLLPDFPLINKSFELCYACVDR